LSERDVRRIMPRPKERRHEGKRQRVEIPLHEHDDEDSLHAYERERNVLDDMTGLASYHGQSLVHNRDRDVLQNTAHHAQRREGKVDLSPCHICHRKPTAKHELDSFADCEECGKRTCWICIRECWGMGMDVVSREMQRYEGVMDSLNEERRGLTRHERGEFEERWEKEKLGMGEEEPQHRGRICSRCCVERGTEGEVWCLGCLRAEVVINMMNRRQ